MSRNTHELDAPHFGELSALRVLLDEAIGVLAEGSSIEAALQTIYVMLEEKENGMVYGMYTANAVIA